MRVAGMLSDALRPRGKVPFMVKAIQCRNSIGSLATVRGHGTKAGQRVEVRRVAHPRHRDRNADMRAAGQIVMAEFIRRE